MGEDALSGRGGTGAQCLVTKLDVPLLQGQAGALTMESKADTRLVMISSLRVKAEFQRSGPQPLAGTSQRFPSKAMITWRERGRRQRWACAIGCGTCGNFPPQPTQLRDPKTVATSQVG